ncbi:uncharacterized protein CIMG_09484 [Coccidioides immitis RS]|uniref:Uncharacterized protein n=2 Tax=Coccidioides immitis TaxID=5501 RepID=A0A0E1RUT2_COCIM|nr:uncharacterized protein CIMG_09484 [Coccidioides immitis RS]EAS28280.1 hypothetical protein CIMG_09484 [Coccidioides immitis RS]KMP09113.1 hypothetical protein CIRG_08794 [Coccidioides immitis RMSCC 2394]TPX20921.1 hypothetical protein DIZ76_016818 [Coccidioides immitis]
MATEVQSLCVSTTSTHVKPQPPAFVDDLFTHYSSMAAAKVSPSPSGHTVGAAAATYPRPNLLKRGVDRLRLEYYRYEVTLGVYVMTPGEKLIFNSFILVVLSLMVWALFLYFPSLLYQKLSRLDWLLTGRDGPSPNVTFSLSNGNDMLVSSFQIPPFRS